MNKKIEEVSERFFKILKFTTGALLRGLSSHQIAVLSAIADKIASRRMSASCNQSFSCPCSSTYCKAPSPTASNPMPVQSTAASLCRIPGGSCKKEVTKKNETSPIGTLMKKHQCHEKLSLMYPPKVGPSVGATMMPMMKIACTIACSSFGNICRRVA